ncbi:hypothetical protein LSAT2_015160 [Lamellibrachia satsuma]|nr:hypothetical protein LSAT2_015160 [Lamellibrachia satsuma]
MTKSFEKHQTSNITRILPYFGLLFISPILLSVRPSENAIVIVSSLADATFRLSPYNRIRTHYRPSCYQMKSLGRKVAAPPGRTDDNAMSFPSAAQMSFNTSATTLPPVGAYGLTGSQDGGAAAHFTDVMSMHATGYPHYGAPSDVYSSRIPPKSLPYSRSVDYTYRRNPAEYTGYMYEGNKAKIPLLGPATGPRSGEEARDGGIAVMEVGSAR